MAGECHVQADTSGCAPLPISKLVFLWQSARRRYWTSALRLLVAEIRALGHRIRWVFEIREVELQRGTDSIRTWMDRGLISGSQNYKRAYIECMRQIEARHPFLSIFDLFLLQQAWKAGSEWNGRTDTSQSQDTSCSYAILESRNSMLPPAVQQSSKHDRSAARDVPPTSLHRRNLSSKPRSKIPVLGSKSEVVASTR